MNRLRSLVEIVGGVLLAAVVVVVLLEVVTRYLLQISISSPEEIARYLLVWLTFIGAAGAAGRRALTMASIPSPRSCLPGCGAAWTWRLPWQA